MFGLALLFVWGCFFCPFSILITCLGKKELVYVLIVHCLFAMHTLICVTSSLPPGVKGWLRLLPGLFCVPFWKIKFS